MLATLLDDDTTFTDTGEQEPTNGPVMERFFVLTWHAIHPRFGVHFSFVWHLYMLLSVGCRQCWPRLIYRRMWRGRA